MLLKELSETLPLPSRSNWANRRSLACSLYWPRLSSSNPNSARSRQSWSSRSNSLKKSKASLPVSLRRRVISCSISERATSFFRLRFDFPSGISCSWIQFCSSFRFSPLLLSNFLNTLSASVCSTPILPITATNFYSHTLPFYQSYANSFSSTISFQRYLLLNKDSLCRSQFYEKGSLKAPTTSGCWQTSRQDMRPVSETTRQFCRKSQRSLFSIRSGSQTLAALAKQSWQSLILLSAGRSRRPKSILQSMTPRDQMSHLEEQGWLRWICGAMQQGVPSLVLCSLLRWCSIGFAKPKSAILQVLPLIRILSGFRSRCTTPTFIRLLHPFSSWSRKSSTSSSPNRFLSQSCLPRSPPSVSSVIRQQLFYDITKLMKRSTFQLLILRRTFSSQEKQVRSSSSPSISLRSTFLTAKVRSGSWVFQQTKTWPQLPSPSFLVRSYENYPILLIELIFVIIKASPMQSIRLEALDFDRPFACDLTNSIHQVYACLACGRFLRGIGLDSPLYKHAILQGHNYGLDLASGVAHSIDCGKPVQQLSFLQDCLNPRYSEQQIALLDLEVEAGVKHVSRTGQTFYRGFVPIIGCSIQIKIVLHFVLKIRPLRDWLLLNSPKQQLLQPLAQLTKRVCSRNVITARLYPYQLIQAVGKKGSSCEGLLAYLLHQMRGLPEQLLDQCRGRMRLDEYKLVPGGIEFQGVPQRSRRSAFNFLTLDLPDAPLFKERRDLGFAANQVHVLKLLQKFRGVHCDDASSRKVYRLERLPRYLMLVAKRERPDKKMNDTRVQLPSQPVSLGQFLGCGKQVYRLSGVVGVAQEFGPSCYIACGESWLRISEGRTDAVPAEEAQLCLPSLVLFQQVHE